jgi:preprotein translocase SecE subunit
MAIINQNKSTLINTNIGDKISTSGNNGMSNVPDQSKKRSFIASVIDELKKVQWPSFRYVVNWSVLVICFTAIFSLILGGADHVFETGIGFVKCSSPEGDKRELGVCSLQLARKLVGINE